MSGPTRAVTRARRDFGPEELAQLDRDQLRKLCHGLLLAEGATVTEVRRQADFDDFAVSTPTLWRQKRSLVRLCFRALDQSHIDDAARYIEAVGIDEVLFLTLVDPPADLTMPHGVYVIPPSDTVLRIIGSPLAAWDSDGPSVAVDRLDLVLRLERADFFDRFGIQWLPSVALNELPPALMESGIEPQDVLERKTFRLVTAAFLFGGQRYGEAARGKRLPDAVLQWPDGSPCSALLDCKAAANGYTMESDHVLRFVEYWDALSPDLEAEGFPLRYMIVVSSHFPGLQGGRHPYYSRAEDILERTGLHLCYVRASDLAWLASTIEEQEMSIERRRRLDWHSALEPGLVTADHLAAIAGGAS
ncbi:MAG: hypothetical protein HY828_18830 [Actinobacteria bacterium]|nr:hypothetical protein [Actinomycetota bacterium]